MNYPEQLSCPGRITEGAHLIFLQRLIFQQTRPEFGLVLVLLHDVHLDGSGQDLVRGSSGIDRFQEGDVDLVLLILGLSLEFERLVFQDDGRVLHV